MSTTKSPPPYLFRVANRLIVATSVRRARQLLIEAVGECRATPQRVTWRVKLSTDYGKTYHWYSPREVAQGSPRVIPEAY